MKKLLMTLGAIAPIAGGSALAVSCGDPQPVTPKPLENETLPEGIKGHTMNVETALNNEVGKSLWLTQQEFLNLNRGSNNTDISQKVWMNMFDARQDGTEPETTKESLKYFTEHDIYKRIKLKVQKTNVIDNELIERHVEKLTDQIREAINDQLKAGHWDEHLNNLQDALTTFSRAYEKEEHDTFSLLSPLFTAIKEFNKHSDDIKLDEDLRITLAGASADNFHVEFVADTIVFFTTGGEVEQFLVRAGEARLTQLTIHITL